jgi:hypothetical protein
MVKFLIASALAALAIADGTDNGISAVCKEDNTIDVTINYDQASKIIGATYGSCNETDIDGAVTSGDVTYWSITLNPSRCGMESKLRNLVYNQTASFRFGRKDGDTEIVFATMEVDSYCNYTSEYTVTFAYGPVNADSYDFTDSGGLLGLHFYIKSYASDWSTEQAPSSTAGEKIYLKLHLNSTINKDFDDATSFDASTGKVFVPTKCEVEDDSSNSYTLFDTNSGAKCSNAFIDLSVSYVEGAGQLWKIEHTLFLLNDEKESSYTLSCTVLVCDMQQPDACVTAKDCLEA